MRGLRHWISLVRDGFGGCCVRLSGRESGTTRGLMRRVRRGR